MPVHESLYNIIHLLGDLTIFKTFDFEGFLKKLIRLILQIVPVDSCLIYFFDRSKNELILIASKKPHAKLLGRIALKKGEGITGWVAETKKIAALKKQAYKDSRFKTFKELPEDKYEAFLSVPIIDNEGVIGVINLQNKQHYSFTKKEIGALEAIVKIISSAFKTIVLERKISKLESSLEERKLVERAKGILMKIQNITEAKAYEMIRHEAMKKRKTKRDIAEAILMVFGD